MFLYKCVAKQTGNAMFSKARLNTLSDGIPGVAMTLLILDIRLSDEFHPRDGTAAAWPVRPQAEIPAEFNGLLVYYTHLMSYRCAIREVCVGIDTAVPDEVLRHGDPNEIPASVQPYLKLAPATQFVSVGLTYRDGSVSEIKSFRR
jgi:hypothetical protein